MDNFKIIEQQKMFSGLNIIKKEGFLYLKENLIFTI